MRAQRIAVIGGVAAGPAAAVQARRTDPDAEIVMFEQGSNISYSACEMLMLVSGEIDDPEQLIHRSPKDFQRERGIEVRAETRVDRIDPRAGKLVCTSGDTGVTSEEDFDKFILATGARASVPDIDGADAENVFVLRRLGDAIELRGFISTETIHHAVVVGAGFVGLEVVEALVKNGIRVSLLEPGSGPMHAHLHEELSTLVGRLLEDHGVVVRLEGLIGLAVGQSGRVSVVRTSAGEQIGCQLVVLAIGTTPNTKLGAAAGIRLGDTGAYLVDDRMRTNIPNVWACGDCVEVHRLVDGQKVIYPQSPTAFRTGRVAGTNAARRGAYGAATFPGIVGAQALRLFEQEIAFVGITEGEARHAGFSAAAVTITHLTRSSLDPGSSPITVRLVFEMARGRLLGAQLVGGTGTALRANILLPLIRSRGTISDLYDLDLLYAPPFSPRMDPLLIAARKAMRLREDTRRRI